MLAEMRGSSFLAWEGSSWESAREGVDFGN